uniref:Uncharacterized protein n=1 Tax=Arundo donax TaxID=35708 RepID=A0A0A8XYM4_ARUDO
MGAAQDMLLLLKGFVAGFRKLKKFLSMCSTACTVSSSSNPISTAVYDLEIQRN